MQSEKSNDADRKEFRNPSFIQSLSQPSGEYTPIPFWFLNDDLSHEELRRQLRDFRDHGVYGVIPHPRMGLSDRIQYLSPMFFSYIRTVTETAAELGMRVVLYDEGMYPSGSAGGMIVRENPDLASRGLGLVEAPRSDDKVLAETKEGFLVERFSGGTIRGIHFGEDDGEENAPQSADILNPEAVKRFIELTHEAYFREAGQYFGNTIIGFFTDEPSILGRNTQGLFPWSKDFGAVFTAAGGSLSGLAALFSGNENEETRLYHRLILEREGKVYYGALSAWCESHGIALMGHPHQSDDIEVQRYFHVPGQDLVFRWVAPETGGTSGMDSVMGKCSADAARLMGRRRNSNECFGACNRQGNPWFFTGSDMKWYIDWLAVRGVNLFIPHAFYYSLAGARSQERPPDVGPGNIWWGHYRKWAAYMTRLSWLMTDIDFQAETAVACRNLDLHPEVAKPLMESQRSFQYLPESLWPECRESQGKLICRGMTYQAVIAPPDLWPGVPHDPNEVQADIFCAVPQPQLRCARFQREGISCWLLTNEGENTIDTEAMINIQTPLAQYDLWNGKAYRLNTKNQNGKAVFHLSLLRRESLLLFAVESKALWDNLSEKLETPYIVPDFTLAEEHAEALQKVYFADLACQENAVTIIVQAEEMAELYVNGSFLDASFWNPHRFLIPGGMLNQKSNELRLVVTGSKANQYGKPVAYGIRESY